MNLNKNDKKKIAPILKPKMNKKSKVKISNRFRYDKIDSEQKDHKPIQQWNNILRGHTVFILGNAPSISNQNLSLLDDYFTIGINRIFYLYDPTILIWQDKQVWDRDKKKILEQKAIKVSSFSGDPRHSFINFRVIYGSFRFTDDPQKLYGTGNTGALAIQLAVALGCSNIILLGTDCKYGYGDKTDFYGINKDHKSYTLKMCSSAMKWVKDNCPIPIYNCSENDYWEKEKLIDVINRIKPKKIGRAKYKEIFGK